MLSLSVFLALIDNEDDRAKFAVFYEKYKDYALNLANSILHNPVSAEDAVQDTFEYLAKHPWRILEYEEKSAKWFLSELIRDFSNNIIRKESTIQKVTFEYLDMQVTEAAFLEAIEQARTQDIKDAIEQLSETDQAIVRLFYTYDFKSKEIAAILNMSDTGIRKRLQRIRGQLKYILQESKEAAYE